VAKNSQFLDKRVALNPSFAEVILEYGDVKAVVVVRMKHGEE